MQNIVLYVNADSTLAYVTDSYGGRYENRVSFTRGFKATLVLRLLTGENGEPYPVSQLEQYTSWRCVFDVDYKQSTTPILSADSDAITVSGDGTVTEVRIPISNMNTNELADAILDFESLAGVTMELVGILPDGTEGFGLQVKGFTIRNRILYSGEPTEQDARFLDREQVLALVASGFDLQFSSDLVEWHETQTDADTHFRFRSEASETAAWSEPVMVPVGPKGDKGLSPTANVVKSGGVATITVTDSEGTTTASVADGLSPTAKVEQVEGVTTITITDSNGTTTASIQAGSGGSVDAYTKAEVDSMLTDYALKSESATDHNHDSQYLKLSGGTLTGSLSATSIASTGNITEGGEALSSKYAAKSHSHAMSDVTGLQAALDAKAASSHTHAVSDVTGLQSALDAKAASSHTHAVSDVTGLQSALDAKAASSHTHAMSDVTGLQSALDAKADAGSVPSSCVVYAETLPSATETSPKCVIVTGATSETQTRGHVYSLLRHEQSITRDLNVSFSTSVFTSCVFRVYGSGSSYSSGGTLYEYDLAWISSKNGTGTYVGEVILFKRKGSDTRWYLHSPSGGTMWRCMDDRCLDISDPLGLSGMTFGHPEGDITKLTITDAGTGSPTIDFICRGETTNLYRVEDYNGKPKWRGKETQSDIAVVHLRWNTENWRLSNDRDVNPTAVYITSTAGSPLDESGKEWTVYEQSHGVIGNFPVTITERPLPPEVSWSYEDITVQELAALRSSLTALEARVAALEVSNSHEGTK